MKKILLALLLLAPQVRAAVIIGPSAPRWFTGASSTAGVFIVDQYGAPAPAGTSGAPLMVSITNQTLSTGAGTTDLNTQRIRTASDQQTLYVSPVAATLPVSSTVQVALATGSITTVNLSFVAGTVFPTDIIFGNNGPAAGIRWKRRACTETVAGVTNGFFLASSGTATVTHNASGTCFDFYSAGVGTANFEYSVGKEGQ